MDTNLQEIDRWELIWAIYSVYNNISYDITNSIRPFFLFRCYKMNDEKFKKKNLLRVTVLELEQISDLFLQVMYVFINNIGACKIILYCFHYFPSN